MSSAYPSIYSSPPPEQGWQCPKCGSVWAPWKSSCRVCNNVPIKTGPDEKQGGDHG